jgi:hypothetical protein
MTGILVTSASGANGDGYGAVLSFTADGVMTGPFSRDRRISDPRGLSLGPSGELVYVNSGDDRVLALDGRGKVVLDSGRIDGLDPGGGTFGPGGRYYAGLRRHRTILALPARLDSEGEFFLPGGIVPFPRGFGFGPGGILYLASGTGPSGAGENTIAVFGQSAAHAPPRRRPRTEPSGSHCRSQRQHRGLQRMALRFPLRDGDPPRVRPCHGPARPRACR